MTIPELKVIKEFETEFPCEDILVYKNYFILYDSIIKIYNSDNYQLIKEINIRGIYSLIHLKDNYLIGLVDQYIDSINDYSIEKNKQIRDLVLYKFNI